MKQLSINHCTHVSVLDHLQLDLASFRPITLLTNHTITSSIVHTLVISSSAIQTYLCEEGKGFFYTS